MTIAAVVVVPFEERHVLVVHPLVPALDRAERPQYLHVEPGRQELRLLILALIGIRRVGRAAAAVATVLRQFLGALADVVLSRELARLFTSKPRPSRTLPPSRCPRSRCHVGHPRAASKIR